MPVCFTLTKKGSTKPEKLVDVDEAICRALGLKLHPEHWASDWYACLGPMMALGASWSRMRESFDGYQQVPRIIDYLEKHYDVENWRE